MKNYKRSLTIILLLFTFASAFSQLSMRWKRTRYELIGGFGMSNFMGDLGGGTNPNSVFDDYIGDFDFRAIRPTINAGMRYKLSPSFALRASLTYGMLKGDDKYSGDSARILRNLHFRSVLFENAFLLEYNIIKEKDSRKWSKRRGKIKRGLSLNWYVYSGIGGFFFNPKAKFGDSWYALQKIGTEGQRIVDDIPSKAYSLYQPCIPMGTGIKIGITRRIDIGAEWGGRITFTDYIDDVGGSYYDNFRLINENQGKFPENPAIPGWLADSHIPTREDGFYNEFNAEAPYKAGDRIPHKAGTLHRGGPANDYYLFFLFNVSYKLKTMRNGLPKFR